MLYDGSVYLEGAGLGGPVWLESLKRMPEQRLGGVELRGNPCGASGWLFESREGSQEGTETGLSRAEGGGRGAWGSERRASEAGGNSSGEGGAGGEGEGEGESMAQERQECSRYEAEEQVQTLAEALSRSGGGAGGSLSAFLELEDQESVVLESLDLEEEFEVEEFYLASEELVQLEQLVYPAGEEDRDGIGLYRFCRCSAASPEVFNVSRGGRLEEVENTEPNNINEASVRCRGGGGA